MRFEFYDNGTVVGAAQWEGPGQVSLEVGDPSERGYLMQYFASETTYLGSVFDWPDDAFQVRRRDWTPWDFQKACLALGHTRGYRVIRTPSGPVEARDRSV